jgi:hypothetical protein
MKTDKINKIEEPTWDKLRKFNEGWMACKEKVLEILNEPLHNADLSQEKCDSRYIDKIKEL